MKKLLIVVSYFVCLTSLAATVSIEIPADKVPQLVAALSAKYPELKWDNATNKLISTKTVILNNLKNIERDYRRHLKIETAVMQAATNAVDSDIAK